VTERPELEANYSSSKFEVYFAVSPLPCTYFAVALRLSETIALGQGNSSSGSPESTWENTIKMGLNEIGSDGVDCLESAQDWVHWRSVVKIGRNLLIP
jgi:hypothetical protein